MKLKKVINRETINGKYYIVARDKKNGRIIDKTKWGKTKISDVKPIFKKNKSFSEDVVRTFKDKVVFVDYKNKKDFRLNPNSKYKANYLVTATYTVNGKKQSISAKGRNIKKFGHRKSKKEAYDNLYRRIAQAVGLEYDANVGKRYIEEHNIKIEIDETISTYNAR